MRWYLEVVKQYAVFGGRARRREFWMFSLVDTIISIVIEVADWLLGTDDLLLDTGALSWVYGLAIVVPTVAVTARRLHDIDRTAWWLLLVFLPVVGWIVLLVFCVTAGTRGPNRFGPDPKAVEPAGYGSRA
jgi:uncharacterized membrane protein YhaH (DUF805 family)